MSALPHHGVHHRRRARSVRAALTLLLVGAAAACWSWGLDWLGRPGGGVHRRGPPTRDQVIRGERKVEWLHLPKTGTGLGNTLLLWACPELEHKVYVHVAAVRGVPPRCKRRFRNEPRARPNWFMGDHISLAGRSDAELADVFALVRSPKARLASGFHWVHKKWPNASEAEICSTARASATAHMALGSQARMIAGSQALAFVRSKTDAKAMPLHLFPSADPPGPAVAAEACRRLALLAFVGVSDLWAASICLFHAQHGGQVVEEVEMQNLRPGFYTQATDSVRRADCGDDADERVFECGLRLFLQRLARHQQCWRHLEAKSFGSPGADKLLAEWLAARGLASGADAAAVGQEFSGTGVGGGAAAKPG